MKRPTSYSDLFGLAAIVAILGWTAWQFQQQNSSDALKVGTPMPQMTVGGWLNVPEGESFDPAGKVVVVDLWATWCGPCRAEIPRLAEVVNIYQPLGVEFVGLTSETKRDLPKVKEFIAKTPSFTWPVGWGAMDFFNSLEIQGIPTVIVFGRDGKIRWSATGAGQSGLEEALDAALAENSP